MYNCKNISKTQNSQFCDKDFITMMCIEGFSYNSLYTIQSSREAHKFLKSAQ